LIANLIFGKIYCGLVVVLEGEKRYPAFITDSSSLKETMGEALKPLLSNRSSTGRRRLSRIDIEKRRNDYLTACSDLKQVKSAVGVKGDSHLVKPIFEALLPNAVSEFRAVHDFLVAQTRTAVASQHDQWAINIKRLNVDLRGRNRPALLGKEEENLVEVLNVAATLERLIASLNWFSREEDFGSLILTECRASAGDATDSYSVVLSNEWGKTRVLCEVCDVASSAVVQPGKEREYLWRLGCQGTVPFDGVRRFICSSPEFAAVVQKEQPDREGIDHRYVLHRINDEAQTVLSEIVSRG
jgi:hypothetical protein